MSESVHSYTIKQRNRPRAVRWHPIVASGRHRRLAPGSQVRSTGKAKTSARFASCRADRYSQNQPVEGASIRPYAGFRTERTPYSVHHWHDTLGRQWLRDAIALPPERQEPMAKSPLPFANSLLASLSTSDAAALRPHLQEIALPQGTVLFEVGAPVTKVYFPHSGVVSLVVELSSGEMIEAAMVGRESLVGGLSALDGELSPYKVIVQIAGRASVLDARRLRRHADTSISLRNALARHEELILMQALQAAACNATHSIGARLARWLLRCRDVQGSNDLPLTQEFLAQMLGVRRPGVSESALMLQNAKLIQYSRGHITIVDLKGLRSMACECYKTVKGNAERLLKR